MSELQVEVDAGPPSRSMTRKLERLWHRLQPLLLALAYIKITLLDTWDYPDFL